MSSNMTINCNSKKCNGNTIYYTYKILKVGEAFTLKTNFDPKKIYYSMMNKVNGKFHWIYLAEGPKEWRVLIEKTITV